MRRAAAAIVLAELGCFAPFLPGMGFYVDDWTIVEWGSRGGGGFLGAVRAMAETGWFWARPMMLLEFPFFYAVGGSEPLGYHAALLLLQAAASLAFFALLKRLLGSLELAAAAACLATLYPIQAASHHWLGAGPQLFAVILACASLWLHLSWLESRRPAALAAGLVCYAASVLSYESCAFLPLMPAGAIVARRVSAGGRWTEGARDAVAGLWPYAAAFLAVQAWQWWLVELVTGARNTKTVTLSPLHAVLSYRAAFEGMTYKALRMCARSAPLVSPDVGRGYWLYWWALVVAVTALLPRAAPPGRRVLLTALGAGLGAFAGAVLPYALSGGYMPNIYGIASRTSAGLALAAGLLLATGLAALRGRRAAWLTALFVGAFVWTNAQTASAWIKSYRLQRAVLKVAAPKAGGLPRGATLLLAGVPSHINQRVNDVPVFNAGFDITSALRLMTGRKDLKARMTDNLVFEPEGYSEVPGGTVVARFTYDNTWLLWYGRGRFDRLKAPPRPVPYEFTLP